MATSDMSDGKTPGGEDPCDALDRQIGFACPEDLKGAPAPAPAALPPEPPVVAPRSAAVTETPPLPPVPPLQPEPAPTAAYVPPAASTVAPAAAPSTRPRDVVADTPEGIRAVTLYALILFAVPTLGVSALVGILAVMGREPPADPLAASHFVFQKRTLWGAAIAAVAGVILIVVNLGVFVLFVAALWTLLRGVVGVIRLKSGRALADPMTLLI
ncbi:MAG TPA: hypothetical protein VGN74_13670 [Brevundimonas sp.]|jgi:uncharacterized membrane protein|uniref:hypothetical protein n=1 Tax=Brevundimonas sp. TaxID=1871086 RepID=UPI002E10F7DB|nr:hypothetical protein [Brevundimonas sp.]